MPGHREERGTSDEFDQLTMVMTYIIYIPLRETIASVAAPAREQAAGDAQCHNNLWGHLILAMNATRGDTREFLALQT